jgi:hypothetical protein
MRSYQRKNDRKRRRRRLLNIVIGLLIGAAAGTAQLVLLALFTKRVTRGEGKFIAAGLAQWLLPFAALTAVAVFYRAALLYAGIGAAAALILGAVLKTFLKGGRS